MANRLCVSDTQISVRKYASSLAQKSCHHGVSIHRFVFTLDELSFATRHQPLATSLHTRVPYHTRLAITVLCCSAVPHPLSVRGTRLLTLLHNGDLNCYYCKPHIKYAVAHEDRSHQPTSATVKFRHAFTTTKTTLRSRVGFYTRRTSIANRSELQYTQFAIPQPPVRPKTFFPQFLPLHFEPSRSQCRANHPIMHWQRRAERLSTSPGKRLSTTHPSRPIHFRQSHFRTSLLSCTSSSLLNLVPC